MKRKTFLKFTVDFMMMILFLVSMAAWITGNKAHERTGIFFLLLIVVHNILNFQWYKTVLKKKYNFWKILNFTINVMLLSAIAVLFISSVIISRTVFDFLNIQSSFSVRQIHTTAAYWFLISVSFHIGIHLKTLKFYVKKIFMFGTYLKINGCFINMFKFIVVVWGIKASFERNILSKLFMFYSFDFYGHENHAAVFFLEYIAISGLYIIIIDFLIKNISNYSGSRRVPF